MPRLFNARAFDFGAPLYDWMTAQEVWRDHVRGLARHFPADTTHILDLGTGPAVSAIALAEADPSWRVTGVDLSPVMLKRARPRVAASAAADRIELMHCDASQLPFGDNTFDAITGHSFLYLLAEPDKVLDEALRVLRPGGRAVFLEPRKGPAMPLFSALRQDPRFALSMVLWRVASGVEGRFDDERARGLLSAHGFAVHALEPTLGGQGLIIAAEKPAAR